MSTRRRTAITLILPGLFWWLGAPTSGHGAARNGVPLAQEVRSYSVDVGLVRLSITARTMKGDLVHDLRQEEFQVSEGGVEQEVVRFGHHEAPISVVVLFDKSSSMQDEKLMHAKDAVVNFARAFRAQDEILVVAFSDGIDVLGHFGLDARAIELAVKGIRVERSTRLYDAVIEGTHAIAGPERKEKRALLVLSDGEDTASDATLDETVEAVRKGGVPVYAIGIEMDANDPPMWLNRPWERAGRDKDPPMGLGPPWKRLGQRQAPQRTPGPSAAIRALSRLTEGMGGWTYRIVAAKRCKEICIRAAEELRNQYLLGYVPSAGPPDGGWRTVTVRTSRRGVTLATRQGYYATTP
jgi:Ca-activated chloride channel family protein